METQQIMDRLEGIEDDVRLIKDALLGNDFNKTGIIHTIAEHHARLNALEHMVERTKWLIVGLSMGAGGFVGGVIQYLIKALT